MKRVIIVAALLLACGGIEEALAVDRVSSGMVNFKAFGTGAVTRTADSKLGDIVSVKDFGAVGDGVTNDTAAIVAAIASFPLGGGDISMLYFPCTGRGVGLAGTTYHTVGTINGVTYGDIFCTPISPLFTSNNWLGQQAFVGNIQTFAGIDATGTTDGATAGSFASDTGPGIVVSGNVTAPAIHINGQSADPGVASDGDLWIKSNQLKNRLNAVNYIVAPLKAGTVALVSGTPSTKTVTMPVTGMVCTCTEATTAANNGNLKCVVAATTLTITGPNTNTDNINYTCMVAQ
jgi:hypothetical protein